MENTSHNSAQWRMNGRHVNMVLVFCRRYRLFLTVFFFVGLLTACIKSETVTGFFHKGGDDFCDSDECRNKELTPNGKEENADPASGLGSASSNLDENKHGRKLEDTEELNHGKDFDEGTKQQSKNISPEPVNILITFTNAEHNYRLQEKFTLTVSSLLKHASVPLAIHIIGDDRSQNIAREILKKVSVHAKSTYKLVHMDVDKLAKALEEVVRPMQDHFSYRPGAYYNHALFFLSIGIHRVLPENISKVIMIDCDLKFKADIQELYERFQLFTETNILGIGRDMQPVYRHTFWSYRGKHPGTRVGEPPPNGLTGFNSGVLLLDLVKMRNSELYNSLLNREALEKLTKEFEFKGHLGDQDFFTLLSMKHEELFHILPCNWNRQLCIWWKDKGYESVFDLYFNCEGDVKIYHGNCGTPIPED